MADYVTDTHSLIWYLTSDARLGERAKEIFSAGERAELLVFVPTISLVEVIYLQEKHKIPDDISTQFRLAISAGTSFLRLYALTGEVVTAVMQIPRASIPDMPDRIIAATALHLAVPLISRDSRIQLSEVETVW